MEDVHTDKKFLYINKKIIIFFQNWKFVANSAPRLSNNLMIFEYETDRVD